MEFIIGFLIIGFFAHIFESAKSNAEERKQERKNQERASRAKSYLESIPDDLQPGARSMRKADAESKAKAKAKENDEEKSSNLNPELTRHLKLSQEQAIRDQQDLDSTLELDATIEFEPTHVEKPWKAASSYSSKARAIQKIAKDRSILKLLHFTRVENLESILKNGIVTRDTLFDTPGVKIVNDKERFDRQTNSISTSISFPNHRMFYAQRMKAKAEAKGWIVLELSPSILWEYDCAYCLHNAADRRVSRADIENFKSADALEEMFVNSLADGFDRDENGLSLSEPTDPQAEVLVFGDIPTKFISSVGFEDAQLLSGTENQLGHSHQNIRFAMAKDYFSSREFVKKWPTAQYSRRA